MRKFYKFLSLPYYTINSANAALPNIIKKFKYSLSCKAEIIKAEQLLSSSAFETLENYITLKQDLNSKITAFYQSLEALESTGVAIKSLDQGLLDFPSKRFDQDIWLCWKDGETEIKFWHEKDVGFMGRKPIETSDESLV